MPYPNQYFPQYPQTYQPQVPTPMDRLAQLQSQYQQTVPQAVPQTNQGLLWVSGEAGAKSYLVAANSTVLLMDSENPVFYLKSADTSGMPLPLRAFDYVERSQNAPQASPSVPNDLDSKYVTRAEYDALNAKYIEILDRLDNFHAPALASESGGKPAAATNKSRGKGGSADE